jgi:ComEC/Rec2-related protein
METVDCIAEVSNPKLGISNPCALKSDGLSAQLPAIQPLSIFSLAAVFVALAANEHLFSLYRLTGVTDRSCAVLAIISVLLLCRSGGREAALLFVLVVLVGGAQIFERFPLPKQVSALGTWTPQSQGGFAGCSAKIDANCMIVGQPERTRIGELRFPCYGLISPRHDHGSAQGKILVMAPDLPWEPLSSASPGALLQIVGSLRPVICGSGEPPLWSDYSAYLLRRGYLGLLRVKRADQIQMESDSSMVPGQRQASGLLKLSTVSAESPHREAIGVLMAAVLGDRDWLSAEAIEAFRLTGTTHLLVVSGFHVGIVYLIVRRILLFLLSRSRRLIVRCPPDPPAALGGLAGIAFYCWLLGGDQTVVRSAVTVGVFAVASLLGRKPGSVQLLLLSLIAISSCWPESFFEAGFQLTAAACLGLIFSNHVLVRMKDRASGKWKSAFRSRALCYLIEITVTSFFAALFTAPVVLSWFNGISPMAPLINIVAIPLFGLGCIGLGALAFGLLWFEFPGGSSCLEFAAAATDLFVEFLWRCAEATAGTQFGYLELSSDSALRSSVIIVCLIIILSLLLRPKKPLIPDPRTDNFPHQKKPFN